MKKVDLQTQVETHYSKVGTAVSKSSVLDGEVAELQADIGGLSAQQLKIDALRADERKIFATTKEDLEHEVPVLPIMALRADQSTVVLRRCAYRDLLSEVAIASCVAALFSASLEEP